MTGAASQSELDDDFEEAQCDDLDLEEIASEDADPDNEVMKLEQMLGRAKDRQKDAQASRGFYHPKRGGKRTGKGLRRCRRKGRRKDRSIASRPARNAPSAAR